MRIQTVEIIGMGALGMLYGDMLADAPNECAVRFIADDLRRGRIEASRHTVNGRERRFETVAPDDASPKPDLLIFAVKATGLTRAMEDASGRVGPDTILLSLLNGITSEAALEARFGRPERVAYCVAQGMDAVRDGAALTYTQRGTLCVGAPDAAREPAVSAVCDLFRRAGVPYLRDEDILHRLWSKFMLNVGVNQAVTVFEGTYGTIQQPGEARDTMIAAMREVIALSKYEGVEVTQEDLDFYVRLMDTLSPKGMPSMRQDSLAGRRTEVELFAGTVCRLAERHGLSVPVNRMLYRRIRQMEDAARAAKARALEERFEFRLIRPEETDQTAEAEKICFPPNEACSPAHMRDRVRAAGECFLTAVDRSTGRIAGFINGIATNETALRDEFFMDASLHDPAGKNIMILGVDVLPEYRMQGLARELMRRFLAMEAGRGRKRAYLTCHDAKVDMYRKMGFEDIGVSASVWGGSPWREMRADLGSLRERARTDADTIA